MGNCDEALQEDGQEGDGREEGIEQIPERSQSEFLDEIRPSGTTSDSEPWIEVKANTQAQTSRNALVRNLKARRFKRRRARVVNRKRGGLMKLTR